MASPALIWVSVSSERWPASGVGEPKHIAEV